MSIAGYRLPVPMRYTSSLTDLEALGLKVVTFEKRGLSTGRHFGEIRAEEKLDE